MTKKTESFRVPSLGEADPEYGLMHAKLVELRADTSVTSREIRELEADMRARPAPAVRPDVAALLGEAVDPSLSGRSARLADLRRRASDLDAAVAIIGRRLAERRTTASAAVRALVRDEYARRVAAVAEALQGVNAAHIALLDIIDQFEREDVAWTSLGPMQPNFLGDPRDGHVQRYLMEARGLGYYGG